MTDLIIVGRITSVFGIQGWVNIYSHTDPMTNIFDYGPWYLHPLPLGSTDVATSKAAVDQVKGAQCRKVSLAEGKKHGKRLVARLDACHDRNTAQQFVQHDIWVPRSLLPDLEGAYYWSDLEGLNVIDQHAQVLGQVDHVIETGANDVLVINPAKADGLEGEKSKANQILIPFVFDHFIIDVDLNNRLIKVDWE